MLIDPAIHAFNGRLVKTAGDSLLIVFDSIDGAVRCAVKVQEQVPGHDGDLPPELRIRFRVGVHVADVIPDGDDVHGDGVNIAARLQAAGPVGGVCVSRAVYDHIRDRMGLTFKPMGALSLKNIAHKVDAFAVQLDPAAPIGAARAVYWRPRTIAAFVALLVAIAVAGTVWQVRRDVAAPQPAAEAHPASPPPGGATPDIGLAGAPRLSLVVLPFNNLDGDGTEDYLVDGITEDLTTDLSRIVGFLVIARNTAYTYKGKRIDIRRVGEELGVRYVLEGSVRKIGAALRVNAQLIATETGTHVWADRFDIAPGGAGLGTDDIVQRIAVAMNVELIGAEVARATRERPGNPDAADLVLRGRWTLNQPITARRRAEALALYERAVQIDPASGSAVAGLANALTRTLTRAIEDPTRQAKLRRVEELVAKAEELRPGALDVMLTRVALLEEQNRCPEAIAAARRVIDSYPNSSGAYSIMGLCLVRTGQVAEAIPAYERALRLNPRYPGLWVQYLYLGQALARLGRYGEAVEWIRKSNAVATGTEAWRLALVYAHLAATQALAGQTEAAKATAAETLRLRPTFTVRSLAAGGSPLGEGFRLAGIPV